MHSIEGLLVFLKWSESTTQDPFDFDEMFNADEKWLVDDLMRLPSFAAERKVNVMVKHATCDKKPKLFGHARERHGLIG
jgi:hypothetical protein